MKIIVTSDDFGYNEERTLGACKLYDDGYFSRASIMVNMPYYENAVILAKEKNIFDKIGLHLNLTEGKPLTDAVKKFTNICDPDGSFNQVFHANSKSRLFLNKENSRALEIEIRAQIEKYISQGFTLMHLDSHQHVHTNYSVYRILKPLIQEYKIKSLRISRNIPVKIRLDKRFYKILFNAKIRRAAYTTDFFTDVTAFSEFAMQIPKNASVEIMLHPIFRKNTREYTDLDVTPMEKVYEILSPYKQFLAKIHANTATDKK